LPLHLLLHLAAPPDRRAFDDVALAKTGDGAAAVVRDVDRWRARGDEQSRRPAEDLDLLGAHGVAGHVAPRVVHRHTARIEAHLARDVAATGGLDPVVERLVE